MFPALAPVVSMSTFPPKVTARVNVTLSFEVSISPDVVNVPDLTAPNATAPLALISPSAAIVVVPVLSMSNVVPVNPTSTAIVPPASTSNPGVNADALLEKDMPLLVTKTNVVDIFAVFAVTKLFTVMLPVPDEAPIVNVEAVIRPNSALAILIFPEVSPTPIVPVDALLESDTNNVVVLLPLVKEPDNKMSFAVIRSVLFVVDNVFEDAKSKSPVPSSPVSVSITVAPADVTF